MENNNNQQQPPPPSEQNNNSNQCLKQLNKRSHKISKKPPIIRKHPSPPHPEQPQVGPTPPVYNINKSDFRDIVQKLTSSSTTPSKPPTSRLHRIRPPPLPQLSNRPAGTSFQMPPPFFNNPNPLGGVRPPLSPLPPLPPVHAAAESPVSAYMRFLRSSAGGFPEPTRQFSPLAPLVSPRRNSFSGPPQQPSAPEPAGWMFPLPPSGCMSTAAAYPPLLSPTAFPLSPTVPVPSPKERPLIELKALRT